MLGWTKGTERHILEWVIKEGFLEVVIFELDWREGGREGGSRGKIKNSPDRGSTP